MRSYFSSIDTTLYSEFRDLSEYIHRARTEIAELRPNDLKQERIPRAGKELEAIVQATEEATGTIMDAAEEIMSADPSADNHDEVVNDACMRIFEACSFQDITGQRITKVVTTLTYIEDRLHKLEDAWGPGIADAEVGGDAAGAEQDDDQALLNGPALAGEGIEQDEVDSLFNQEGDGEPGSEAEVADDAATASPDAIDEIMAAETEVADDAATASPEAIDEIMAAEADEAAVEVDDGADEEATAAAADSADDEADDEEEPELDNIVALTKKPGEEASQAEIDALFD
jgi:chemotaxis protein CheZ